MCPRPYKRLPLSVCCPDPSLFFHRQPIARSSTSNHLCLPQSLLFTCLTAQPLSISFIAFKKPLQPRLEFFSKRPPRTQTRTSTFLKMFYNHPSAYMYSNSSRPSSSTRSEQSHSSQWTPLPHVGASEGASWSPYLKAPLPIKSRPRHDSAYSSLSESDWHRTLADLELGKSCRSVQDMGVHAPRARERAVSFASSEQGSLPSLSHSSCATSTVSSISDESEDKEDVEQDLEENAWEELSRTIEARDCLSYDQEPASPVPSFATVFASPRREE
ncbi:unnamed protein product [Mortierella alpina]